MGSTGRGGGVTVFEHFVTGRGARIACRINRRLSRRPCLRVSGPVLFSGKAGTGATLVIVQEPDDIVPKSPGRAMNDFAIAVAPDTSEDGSPSSSAPIVESGSARSCAVDAWCCAFLPVDRVTTST